MQPRPLRNRAFFARFLPYTRCVRLASRASLAFACAAVPCIGATALTGGIVACKSSSHALSHVATDGSLSGASSANLPSSSTLALAPTSDPCQRRSHAVCCPVPLNLSDYDKITADWLQEAATHTANPTAAYQLRMRLLDRSITLYERAVQRITTVHGPTSPRLLPVLMRLAAAKSKRHGVEEGLVAFENALNVVDADQPPPNAAINDADRVTVLMSVGNALFAMSRYRHASTMFERISKIAASEPQLLHSCNQFDDPQIQLFEKLGTCAQRLGDFAKARQLYERALELDAVPRSPQAVEAVAEVFPNAAKRYREGRDTPNAIDALLGLAEISLRSSATSSGSSSSPHALTTAESLVIRAFQAWRSSQGTDNWTILRRVELREVLEESKVDISSTVGPLTSDEEQKLWRAWKHKMAFN